MTTTLDDISNDLKKTNKSALEEMKERNKEGFRDSKVFKDMKESFNTNFSSMTESLKPSSIIGLIGGEMSSPIVNMLGSKLSGVESFIGGMVKNSFQQEAKDEEKIAQTQRTNDILEQISQNTGLEAENSESGGGKLSGLMNMMKDPKKGIATLVSGLTGGVFMKGLTSKSGGLLKTLFGGLGKLALPVAILFGAKDFVKGMKDVEKIAGTDNIIDAVEVGIAEVLSKLTFGLLSTKTIYEGIDFIKDQFVKILRAPFLILNDLIKGEKPIGEILADGLTSVISGLTGGFIKDGDIKDGIKFVFDKIIKIFTAPFDMIKELFTSEDPINVIIERNLTKFISGMTMGIFSNDTIKEGIDFVVDKIKYLLFHPIKSIESMFNSYMDFLELPHVDISGFVDSNVQKIKDYFGGIKDSIFNFKDMIIQSVKDKINGMIESFGGGVDYLVDIKDSINNGIFEYFDGLKNSIFNFKDMIIQSVKDKINGMIESFSGGVDSAIDFGGDVKDKITQYFDGLKNSILNFKDQFIQNIKDKFAGMFDFFGDDDDDVKDLKERSNPYRDKFAKKENYSQRNDYQDRDIMTKRDGNAIAGQYRREYYTPKPEKKQKDSGNVNTITSVTNNNVIQGNRSTDSSFHSIPSLF